MVYEPGIVVRRGHVNVFEFRNVMSSYIDEEQLVDHFLSAIRYYQREHQFKQQHERQGP